MFFTNYIVLQKKRKKTNICQPDKSKLQSIWYIYKCFKDRGRWNDFRQVVIWMMLGVVLIWRHGYGDGGQGLYDDCKKIFRPKKCGDGGRGLKLSKIAWRHLWITPKLVITSFSLNFFTYFRKNQSFSSCFLSYRKKKYMN